MRADELTLSQAFERLRRVRRFARLLRRAWGDARDPAPPQRPLTLVVRDRSPGGPVVTAHGLTWPYDCVVTNAWYDDKGSLHVSAVLMDTTRWEIVSMKSQKVSGA